jgi:hypothetical protein
MRHRRRGAPAARLLAMPIALLAGMAAFGSGQAQASPRVGRSYSPITIASHPRPGRRDGRPARQPAVA